MGVFLTLSLEYCICHNIAYVIPFMILLPSIFINGGISVNKMTFMKQIGLGLKAGLSTAPPPLTVQGLFTLTSHDQPFISNTTDCHLHAQVPVRGRHVVCV